MMHAQIISCLTILCSSCIGVFHHFVFDGLEPHVSFYISLCSSFLWVISFVLLSFFSSSLARSRSLEQIKKFNETLLNIDSKLINEHEIKNVSQKFVRSIASNESRNITIYSRILPFLACFLTISLYMVCIEFKLLFSIICGVVMLHVVLHFFSFINDSRFFKSIIEVLHNVYGATFISSIRGIQFFDASSYVLDAYSADIHNIKEAENRAAVRRVWRSFFALCFVFIVFCISYFVTDISYTTKILEATAHYIIPTVISLLFCALSLMHYNKLYIALDIDSFIPYNCTLQKQYGTENCKKLKKDNGMFIAFHGISFHSNSATIFNELTFSVLPGEILAITGENSRNSAYIFDLLLGFYRPQSGNIYIAGQNINTLDIKNLRSQFCVFKTDYAIINGSLLENIQISSDEQNIRRILRVCEKVGLTGDLLNESLCDFETGKIVAAQEILLRLQMARFFLRKRCSVALIEAPIHFEAPDVCDLFYDFVSFASKGHTIIIETNDPSFFVQAGKILYIGHDDVIFGNHAELSTNNKYQKFLKTEHLVRTNT